MCLLLSKNKYNLAEIGNNTLVIIDQNNELYRSGDLLLIKKQNNTNLSKKDVVFYYNTHSDMKLDIASVVKVEKISSKETTYLLDNFNASVNTKLDKLCFKVVPNDLSIFRVSILAIVLSC